MVSNAISRTLNLILTGSLLLIPNAVSANQAVQESLGDSIPVFQVSTLEYLAGAFTLGSQMQIDPDGKGNIACDVYVNGNFDVKESYCEGVVSGQRAYLVQNPSGEHNVYTAHLSGLDPGEEVRVVLSSPKGVSYEAYPRLNSPNKDLPRATESKVVLIQDEFALMEPNENEKAAIQIGEGPDITLSLDYVICDTPQGFCFIEVDRFANRGPRVGITVSWEGYTCPPDQACQDIKPGSKTYQLTEGGAIELFGTIIRLDDIFRVRTESSLDTIMGLPKKGKYIPAFFVEDFDRGGSVDAYLVGILEKSETITGGINVLLSGETLFIPDKYLPDKKVWTDASKKGYCVKIPVNLSWPGTDKLTASGKPEAAQCFDIELDLPLEVHSNFPADGKWEAGFYLDNRLYFTGGKPLELEFKDGEMRAGFNGVSVYMPDTWFPKAEKYWVPATNRGCFMLIPLNIAGTNDKDKFWAWGDITYACPK